jgi:hypothetical protein
MIELLAVPSWQTPPTTLEAWVARFEQQGEHAVVIERESPEGAWVHLEAIGARGFAVLAGQHVEAINFEIDDRETEAASRFLEEAAAAIGWEIHTDEDDGEDDRDTA